MATAKTWIILRMNYYAESFAQMVPMLLHSGVLTGLREDRVAYVKRDDVATAAAGILLGRDRTGAIYNATGPAALNCHERAAAIREVTGKPMIFHVLDETQLRDGLVQAGIPAPISPASCNQFCGAGYAQHQNFRVFCFGCNYVTNAAVSDRKSYFYGDRAYRKATIYESGD